MSNMRNDVKIRRVINRYGLEGYGLYCLVLESVTESLTTLSPVPDLQETCADIAEFYNSDTTRINEMMAFMLNNGLFELDELTERVVCHKLYKFLESSQTRSAEVRQMITQYRNTLELPEPSQTVTDCHGQSRTMQQKYEEENRREENRIEEDSVELKPDRIPYSEIVQYLNKTCGTQYKPGTATTRNLIRARWNDGSRLEDFKQVIDVKWREWGTDPKMLSYLRPQTLFGTKMEAYLQNVKPATKINQTVVNTWTCECGESYTGSISFCAKCGKDRV